MRKNQFIISFVAALFLSNCATQIPNIEACSGINKIPGVVALCQHSNTDDNRRMNVHEWLDFLYAQPERDDPYNKGKKLPAKGPAVCMSSEDYQKNDAAIARLCVKGKCTYSQRKSIQRLRDMVKQANPEIKFTPLEPENLEGEPTP